MSLPEVSESNPTVKTRRGYRKSGYAFHFTRCATKEDLRDYMRSIPGVQHQPWFHADDEDDIPFGAAAVIPEDVLPGLIGESIDGFLVSCHIAVVADGDRKSEVRCWRHEIGHVCYMALMHYREVFLRGIASVPGAGDTREEDIATMKLGQKEFPAYCNEYLCEIVDNLLNGDDATRAESGFCFLFPWLGLGGLK